MGSEKSFGIVFGFVFLVIGFFPLSKGENMHLWALVLALIFLLLAYFVPETLSILNKIWFKLGMAIGAIVAPIVMTFIYVITVAPIGLIIRLIGVDLLRQKLNKNTKSYWIERDQSVNSMRDQF